MFPRSCSPIKLCLLICLAASTALTFGQENPATAEQVIGSYLEALGGADKIAAITSFSEKGEGISIGSSQRFGAPGPLKQHWTFEAYFKAPNLRITMTFGENGVLGMQGCNGEVAWYINRAGQKLEYKPKPDNEYTCLSGVNLMPLLSRDPELKIQLKGKKKVADQMAWEIKAANPKSAITETFYFDVGTHLLLRAQAYGLDQTYSDYHDVGGFKFPFTQVVQTDRSKTTTTIRELKLNVPLDNARFEEPSIGREQTKQPVAQIPSLTEPPVAPPPARDQSAAVAAATSSEPKIAPAPQVSYVNTTNYILCSIAELQRAVPELQGLKPDETQSGLSVLLDKVGARTVELVRKIPNLIADEEVIEPQLHGKSVPEKFSYLIVAHRGPDAVTLDEFRVDLKTGARIESDAPTSTEPPLEDLARASTQISARSGGAPPLSQGYASMWIRFFPSNRSESNFRYLGQQKINGLKTLVVVFAQKPGSVRMPGRVLLKEKSLPVYYQGVAWIDASDFRIIRLRSDLLEPIYEFSLTQLTGEVEFADTRAGGFPALLWLPREVQVTSQLSGRTFQDKHRYSNYRSFQVHTRLLIDQ
jgi:hypothetical protein